MFCKHILVYFYTTLNQSYCKRGSSRMYKKHVHQLVRLCISYLLVTRYWILFWRDTLGVFSLTFRSLNIVQFFGFYFLWSFSKNFLKLGIVVCIRIVNANCYDNWRSIVELCCNNQYLPKQYLLVLVVNNYVGICNFIGRLQSIQKTLIQNSIMLFTNFLK